MTLATSRNLTILGIATIIGGLATAATQYAQGGFAAVNIGVLFTAITTGIGLILGKGAASTGGTVDASGNPIPTIAAK